MRKNEQSRTMKEREILTDKASLADREILAGRENLTDREILPGRGKKKYGRALCAAGLAAILSLGLSAESLAYSIDGPGASGGNIVQYTDTSSYNNPAYNTGWNQSAGPGAVGTNPLGDQTSANEDIYAEGPGSDEAVKLAEEEADSYYIYETYRGGTWEQQADGSWKLYDTSGQPVSSKWAYVDGKTYLTDMYGTMLTGFQRVNGERYYFKSTGEMQTGWLLKEGKYYFLNSDGTMAYGWVNSLEKWYYLDQTTGVMATNTYTPDGRYVNAEGILIQ